MKLLRWTALPLTLASLVLPTLKASALPMEPDYPCYMRTVSGTVVDLAALCKGASTTSTTSVSSSGGASIKPTPADIKVAALRYSDAYCEARKEGMTDRQASSVAGKTMARDVESLLGLAKLDGLVNDQDAFFQVLDKKTVLCPQFVDR